MHSSSTATQRDATAEQPTLQRYHLSAECIVERPLQVVGKIGTEIRIGESRCDPDARSRSWSMSRSQGSSA
jgi:hypothetical protein